MNMITSNIFEIDPQFLSEDVGSRDMQVDESKSTRPSPYDRAQFRKIRSLAFTSVDVHFRGFAPSVTTDQLRNLFGRAARILHLVLHKHPYAGHGFVMYKNLEEAKIAVELFDYYVYKEKLIRVLCPELDTMRERDECTKVVIKNVELSMDEKCLRALAEPFGTVISCNFPRGSPRDAYRCAVVEFENKEAAREMMQTLNLTYVDNLLVEVSPLFCISKRGEEEEDERERLRRTVVVSNMSGSYQLQDYFRQCGYITGVDIDMDEYGHSKGVGYVSFRKVEDADFAVKKMDGYKHDDKIWSVQKAPVIFDQEKSRKVEHLQDGYIQIKNLHGFVSDEPLREMFSEFGPIKFCKVMRDSQGQSIGTGFVEFFTPADATRAVNDMNGKVIVRKPLSVYLFEHKDEAGGSLY
ncbi:putative RNA-binding protein 19 [Ranunculus cassubicifolius]